MKRIRVTLLLLALGILVPTAGLVLRAVESVELESVYRHEAVAERIFDEMERSLSDFLLREEARSADDYDLGLPERGSRTPESPRFDSGDEPFILGWFNLDRDGRLRLLSVREAETNRLTRAVDSAFGRGDLIADSAPRLSQSLAVAEKDAPSPGRTMAISMTRS